MAMSKIEKGKDNYLSERGEGRVVEERKRG